MGVVNWSILLTRGIVWVAYAAVFIYACIVSRSMTGNWTRKATLYIFMIVSGYWTLFYTHLLVTQWDVLNSSSSAIAMWSRVGHLIGAVGMWTIISFLEMVRTRYVMIPIGREVE